MLVLPELTVQARVPLNSAILLPQPPECWDYRDVLPSFLESPDARLSESIDTDDYMNMQHVEPSIFL